MSKSFLLRVVFICKFERIYLPTFIFKLQFKYHLKIMYLNPFSNGIFFACLISSNAFYLSQFLFMCVSLSLSLLLFRSHPVLVRSFLECASSSLSFFKCFEINIMVDFCCYLLVSFELWMWRVSRDAGEATNEKKMLLLNDCSVYIS